ncbi:hypothetical protein NE865_04670 [Phthorimaea operculella]|nr:hypothetical protein NE865_04670 [Phthorimaea operculella]
MGWAKTRKQIAEERRKKKVRYSYKSYSITQAFLPTVAIRCQGGGEDHAKAVARIVHALKMGWAKTRKQIAEERRKKKVRYSYKSYIDAKAVVRIVHALKMGWAKTRKQIAEERRKKKRSFLPSQSDAKAVARIVHALKMGWAKTRKQIAEERRKKKERVFYNLWGSTNTEEEEKLRGIHKHIPAPKRPPPGHAESYNPPPEYLLDKKELKEWNKLSETPWKRKYTFLPVKYPSLRAVPAYERFIRERFLRCLDLYLAPRAIKMRLTISPEDLVPKLPSPRDLQPFPTTEVLCLKGHTALVRSVDFDPSGQYMVSGSDDGYVKVWETATGRCLRSIELKEPVTRVAWTPATGLSLVAAAVGNKLLLLNPGSDIGCHKVAERTDELLEEPPPQHDVVNVYSCREEISCCCSTLGQIPGVIKWLRGLMSCWRNHRRNMMLSSGNKLLLLNPGSDIGCHKVAERTDELLEEPPPQHDIVMDERTSAVAQWTPVSPEDWARGVRLAVTHFRPLTHLAWHARGDYITVTLRDAAARAVVVHQISRRRSQLPFGRSKGLVQCALFHPIKPLLFVAISRRRSQLPFGRSKGLVQCALFHPIKPLLFVATQRVVRVYDLVKQELVRKLLTGAQWISALAIHPAGDNLLVASYDRKCMWFDLELSSQPYRTLRLHGGAVRAAAFHKRYPLFATAGDDKNIVVSHGMVYNDLLQNPLLVPLKQLRGPEPRADLCVTDIRFHPTQPWLAAAGADNTIRLYS